MIGWAELNPKTPIIPAYKCDINIGVVDTNTVEKNLPARIYVEAAQLLLGHSKSHVEMKLAAHIEAIFIVMGEPDTTVR
jgi:hypothetical protein